jgi:2-keto-4-pentenoate hydratase/2-oxohepta-3-ene-1,7-dioic acid hydratase in catechol pathway
MRHGISGCPNASSSARRGTPSTVCSYSPEPPVGRLTGVRIARFTTGADPAFGVVDGPDGNQFVAELVGDPLLRGIELSGQRFELDEVRLLAPVLPRSKVVCIGRNYVEHASELGHDVPTEPLIFIKPNTSVIGPREPVVYPRQTRDLHYEGELAVVIRRICKDVPADRSKEVIFGYTIGNDVTARDLQAKDVQFTRSKSFDTFCPLGPWIETELDPSDLSVTTTLGDQVRQAGRTSQMVFDVPAIVAYITSVMTLLPADVILTGTPAGVGPMRVGDEVTVAIEGIGSLTNPVVSS